MQILSATQAVSPAFSRTKLVLFSPFRWGRTWKLSATAYCTRIGMFFLPFPLLYLAFLPQFHRRLGGSITTAIIVGAVLLTLLYVWVFYLCSRLGFAFFDVVLLNEKFIAPAWRRHGPASSKWTTLKFIVGAIVSAAFAVPLAHYMKGLVSFIVNITPAPGQPPSPQMMKQLLSFYASFFLVYFIFGLIYFFSSLAADFVVPSLALENVTLAEGFRRLWRLFVTEPGQVTLYAIVKLGLGLALYLGGTIALEIVLLIVALVYFLVIFLIGFLLGFLHVPSAVLGGLFILALVLFYILVLYFFMIGLGAFLTFFEAYTLYFLGGRYPLLGDALDRSTPPPPPPPGYPLGMYAPPPPYAPPPVNP
jgi:hypothetical protein